MKSKPNKSIYNLLAIGDNNQPLFGRYCKTKKEARLAVINHGDILRVNHVVFKERVYNMKEVFKL